MLPYDVLEQLYAARQYVVILAKALSSKHIRPCTLCTTTNIAVAVRILIIAIARAATDAFVICKTATLYTIQQVKKSCRCIILQYTTM